MCRVRSVRMTVLPQRTRHAPPSASDSLLARASAELLSEPDVTDHAPVSTQRARAYQRLARQMRAAVPWLLALALLVSIAPAGPASTALAAQSVALPFSGGKSVKIIQGYNGGTHQGRSKFGLDLVL